VISPADPAPVEGVEAAEELGAVPDAFTAVDAVGHLRDEAGGDDEVAGLDEAGAAARAVVLHLDADGVDGAAGVSVGQMDRVHLGVVGDTVRETGLGPFEIVVEFVPGGEEVLVVHELRETARGVQIGDEAPLGCRVAEGRQILQEGNLHLGVGKQHVAVPAE
jgi:hypothetical protein